MKISWHNGLKTKWVRWDVATVCWIKIVSTPSRKAQKCIFWPAKQDEVFRLENQPEACERRSTCIAIDIQFTREQIMGGYLPRRLPCTSPHKSIPLLLEKVTCLSSSTFPFNQNTNRWRSFPSIWPPICPITRRRLAPSQQLTSRKPVSSAITSHWDSPRLSSLWRAYFNPETRPSAAEPNNEPNLWRSLHSHSQGLIWRSLSFISAYFTKGIQNENSGKKLRQRIVYCS